MNVTSSGLSELLALATSVQTRIDAATLVSSLSGRWREYVIPAALGYVALCRVLRYRGEKRLRRSIGFPEGCGREALAGMTNDQAQQVIRYLACYEFPEFHLLALQFGLFKTYGVESISRLLLATRNLTDPVKSLKRYEDTATLISEFMFHAPDSERTVQALARVNFLHSKYVREGTISNADLLYTLSVFVLEPGRFARRYEWRALNEVERCAYGVFWKAIGDAMGIEYAGLLARHGAWRDGIDWVDDIEEWARRYEADHMKPSPVANKPARALIPMLTYWLPWFAKPFAEEAICVLMGDRVREAFMLPEPGIVAAATVYPLLLMRSLFLRYLALPRLWPVARIGAPADPATGRMNLRFPYGNYPFYVRPTLWNRWGPGAWAVWLYGAKVPGDDPDEYMPQGYLWTDLGPRNRMGQGAEEMQADVKRMTATSRGGCPF
ncbi:putative dephospho- kinase [Rosellinia necatrix]|uniref:Putative dephospho-kinase n=1 Tax=Rosellinia necatrix TaxID=77044 RepID=A0A1W2TAM9_ROSNE|nr:putative dephospho- kinase [Rosellinia necatrix]